MTQNNPFTYSRADLAYLLNGKPVSAAYTKGSCEAAIQHVRFLISDVSLKLQQGSIDIATWYAAMKEHTKMLHMAEAALARGGWDNMSQADWRKVEQKIFNQWAGVGEPPFKGRGEFPGLRRFAEDVERGRYGTVAQAVTDATGKIITPARVLNGQVTRRAGQYADSGKATYENTRLEVSAESGHDWGMRIAGNNDHCFTCQNENGVKRPINEVVLIGDSECGGSKCNCILVTGRD